MNIHNGVGPNHTITEGVEMVEEVPDALVCIWSQPVLSTLVICVYTAMPGIQLLAHHCKPLHKVASSHDHITMPKDTLV